ncbi:MAG TPA: SDR family oxidoreductase [Rhizomicrobium sp.]|nr:SDR family oxidoreductase [Rhizomicrobium sp.]
MPADRPLAGRHAVVTGASRGIGAAIAVRLAQMGALTTLMGRDHEALDREVARSTGAHGIICDVTDPAQVDHAFAEARARAPFAILINNAGIAESAPFLKTSDAMLDRLMAINVTSAFRCTRAALPSMIELGWGRVVNISSIAGLHGAAYITGYSATKHALVGFTRALAAETARQGITVNAVCPGYVDTDLVHNAVKAVVAKTGHQPDKIIGEMVRHNRQGRLLRPEEVADTVAWLCGPDAGSVNGQAIAITGGEVV